MFEKTRLGHQALTDKDIENQMYFKDRKELYGTEEEAKGPGDLDDNPLREMTEYEKDLLLKFAENDAEIDQMLDVVIEGVGRLKLHAQDIG